MKPTNKFNKLEEKGVDTADSINTNISKEPGQQAVTSNESLENKAVVLSKIRFLLKQAFQETEKSKLNQ